MQSFYKYYYNESGKKAYENDFPLPASNGPVLKFYIPYDSEDKKDWVLIIDAEIKDKGKKTNKSLNADDRDVFKRILSTINFYE